MTEAFKSNTTQSNRKLSGWFLNKIGFHNPLFAFLWTWQAIEINKSSLILKLFSVQISVLVWSNSTLRTDKWNLYDVNKLFKDTMNCCYDKTLIIAKWTKVFNCCHFIKSSIWRCCYNVSSQRITQNYSESNLIALKENRKVSLQSEIFSRVLLKVLQMKWEITF